MYINAWITLFPYGNPFIINPQIGNSCVGFTTPTKPNCNVTHILVLSFCFISQQRNFPLQYNPSMSLSATGVTYALTHRRSFCFLAKWSFNAQLEIVFTANPFYSTLYFWFYGLVLKSNLNYLPPLPPLHKLIDIPKATWIWIKSDCLTLFLIDHRTCRLLK